MCTRTMGLVIGERKWTPIGGRELGRTQWPQNLSYAAELLYTKYQVSIQNTAIFGYKPVDIGILDNTVLLCHNPHTLIAIKNKRHFSGKISNEIVVKFLAMKISATNKMNIAYNRRECSSAHEKKVG